MRSVFQKVFITLIAAVAFYSAAEGLLNLDRMQEKKQASIEAGLTALAFGPGLFLLGTSIILMAILSFVLTWKVVPSKPARLLALFSALLACGYGFLFNANAFAWYINYLGSMASQGWSKELVVVTLRAAFTFELLLWIPAWIFACAVYLRLLGIFPNSNIGDANTYKVKSGLEWKLMFMAVLLPSWLYMAAISPPSWWFNMLSFLLGLVALVYMGYINLRSSSDKKEYPGVIPILILACCVVLYAVIEMMSINLFGINKWSWIPFLAVASFGLIRILPRVVEKQSLLVYLPPLLLTTVYISMGASGIVIVSLPWMVICFGLGGWMIANRIRVLAPEGRKQAMWILSGFSFASLFAITWGLMVVLGNLVGCSSEPGGLGICAIMKYQDWPLFLPLPIMMLFFTIALFYKGDIDASVIFQRTTLYGSVVILMVFLFGIFDYAISEMFGDRLSKGGAPAVSTGLIAVAAHPVKKTVQGWVEGLMKYIIGI